MVSKNIKLFIGISVLLAYMSIGIFGLFRFSHMSETPMIDCPYAENGFSVCDNSFDHINNWQQFTSTVVPALFVLALLLFGIILYFLNQKNFLNQKQYFYKWKYYLYNKKLLAFPNRIIKWLSLLENSPSFSA